MEEEEEKEEERKGRGANGMQRYYMVIFCMLSVPGVTHFFLSAQKALKRECQNQVATDRCVSELREPTINSQCFG